MVQIEHHRDDLDTEDIYDGIQSLFRERPSNLGNLEKNKSSQVLI